MEDFQTITIAKSEQVATITVLPKDESLAKLGANRHWDLASAFSALREDDSVRVIVVTGSEGKFGVPPQTPLSTRGNLLTHPPGAWRTFTTGIIRCLQAMIEIEKPIVAKVNGDAISFGQSVAFASDIIVAVEDARFIDHHMALDEVEGYEMEFGLVPGDGGILMPLFMSPVKAKECLMLAKAYTARELAQLGIINYAVPASELDAKVADIVSRLLRRSAYALAWTKRVANRMVAAQLNLCLDAAAAYEMVTVLQAEDRKTLE